MTVPGLSGQNSRLTGDATIQAFSFYAVAPDRVLDIVFQEDGWASYYYFRLIRAF